MGKLQGRMGLCTWVCSVMCAVCFEVVFCARALCVRAHAVVRAQGRALCADSGLPGLRAGGALTWADVLVLVCVFLLAVQKICAAIFALSSHTHPSRFPSP